MKIHWKVIERVIVLSLLLVLAVLTWTTKLDASAKASVDAGLQRALVTYASARVLNGFISLAQGTEINIGVGVSGTFSVGQVLTPINDMVEDFANFMLAASVAFGIEKALLVMGQYQYLRGFLVAVLVIWGAVYLASKQPPRWLNSFLLVLLLVRFAIPVVTVGSDAIFQRFLAVPYQTSQATIGTVTQSVKQVTPSNFSSLNPKAYVAQFKQQADLAIQHVVQLFVVFLLQTLLIPLFLLWAMYFILKSTIHFSPLQRE
ncbi:MAG: hypothetical protein WCA45_14025 [Thiobacillaceae bacterium]